MRNMQSRTVNSGLICEGRAVAVMQIKRLHVFVTRPTKALRNETVPESLSAVTHVTRVLWSGPRRSSLFSNNDGCIRDEKRRWFTSRTFAARNAQRQISFQWIQIGAQKMARYASDRFNCEHPFGRDDSASQPARYGALSPDAQEAGQGALSADGLACVFNRFSGHGAH